MREQKLRVLLPVVVLTGVLVLGLRLSTPSQVRIPCGEPPAGLTVAFLADQGLGPRSVEVLKLIRSRGADAVVHSGDLDYRDDPEAWEAQIDAVLGADFPYLASAGNHDTDAWKGPKGYQARLEARLSRMGIGWEGTLGVAAHVEWRGLCMVFVSPAVFQVGSTESAPYLAEHFRHSDCRWRIASWHKNQHTMQTGSKRDAVGWKTYEGARRAGAIIATGHEHSYSRTHLLSDFSTRSVFQQIPPGSPEPLVLAQDDPNTRADEGRTFAFVSGLGGKSIRDQEVRGPWFASTYTSDQNAGYGALFCTFHIRGDPGLAHCWFEDVDGNVPDEFFVKAPAPPAGQR